MNFKKTTDKSIIGVRDSKARRVLNTSNKVANITAQEIEAGVSIETLENINVPVYEYQTQITIHGKLPGANVERFLVNGYKSIFLNKNGTIGVKYSAIDGEKKKMVRRAWSAIEKTKMSYVSDSQGVQLVKGTGRQDIKKAYAAALELINEVPDNFIGCKQVCFDCYGGVYAVIGFDAIREKNLWDFITWFTFGEIKNLADLEIKEAEKEVAKIKETAKREAKQNLENAENDVKKEELKKPLIEILINSGAVYKENVPKNGIIVNVAFNYDLTEAGFNAYEYKPYGKTYKFRKASSRDLSGFTFEDKWKIATKYNKTTCSGFLLKTA